VEKVFTILSIMDEIVSPAFASKVPAGYVKVVSRYPAVSPKATFIT
jgi:hypothetical protein